MDGIHDAGMKNIQNLSRGIFSNYLTMCYFPAYCDSAPPSQPQYAYNTTTSVTNQLGQLITYHCFTGSYVLRETFSYFNSIILWSLHL